MSKEGLVGGLPDATVPSESRTGAKLGANMNKCDSSCSIFVAVKMIRGPFQGECTLFDP